MLHRSVALILTSVMLVHAGAQSAGAQAKTPQPDAQSRNGSLKIRVLEIPIGTRVEAWLLSKEKLKGEMGEVTDEGFSLRAVDGNPSQSRAIPFAELKSIKVAGQDASLAKPLLKSLALVGVMAGLILLAASATK